MTVMMTAMFFALCLNGARGAERQSNDAYCYNTRPEFQNGTSLFVSGKLPVAASPAEEKEGAVCSSSTTTIGQRR
jgi:hypothetical protein